jgi:hypothetical protein
MSEESAVIVFGAASEGFATELSILASTYEQEAVGLLEGTSSLVYGSDTSRVG